MTSGDGDCFDTAVHLLLRIGPKVNAKVVHGVCVGRGPIAGKKYVHAWVEVGNLVLDFSNGLTVAMERDKYYQLGQVGVVRKYSHHLVRDQLAAYQHYGPWEEVFFSEGMR